MLHFLLMQCIYASDTFLFPSASKLPRVKMWRSGMNAHGFYVWICPAVSVPPFLVFPGAKEEPSSAVGARHSCGPLHRSRALHVGPRLLFADNKNINRCACLGSNLWFSINVSFFCTDQTRGTRSTWNMYCWVLLRFIKNKIIKGNPSPLDPEATKSCTYVCGWGDTTIGIQILLHCLKRFFLFVGHSYSTRLWPHNHNWAALHLFEIATITAGKRQAKNQVCSVSHRLVWVW